MYVYVWMCSSSSSNNRSSFAIFCPWRSSPVEVRTQAASSGEIALREHELRLDSRNYGITRITDRRRWRGGCRGRLFSIKSTRYITSRIII
uniref:Secreted protein n=1 Tax=Trichogramma kaykai TaxID=54128 RepID=A0ABD2WQV8_9HYME